MKDLQSEFGREIEGMTDSEIGKVIDSVMVFYDVFENEIVCDFCNGSYGVDLPYSNARGNSCISLNAVALWADSDELKGIMEQAVKEGIKYQSGELEYLTDGSLSSEDLDGEDFEKFQEISKTLEFLKTL